MNDVERHLIQKAMDGNRAAFEELVRRTTRLVFARLYLDIGHVHRAEDLTQETFLLAYRSLHTLANPEGFRAWLLSIAHNVLVDAVRHDARLKRVAPSRSETPLGLIPSQNPPPDARLEEEERRQRVLAVLRSLPETYRLPLTLRYIVGADAEEISTQLGLTNGTLRGQLHRGLKMLRDRLSAEME
jgi:RNA polymerase sigma-70 factor, ECF subfamily